MRVLILGSGAKDHAIAWWFYQSNCLEELFIAPGNVATGRFATNLNIDPSDPVEVYEMCIEHSINYVFIGTEAPLFTGVVDYLNERGIHTFGAPKRALKLEADRNFARAFTDRHNIPTPRRNLFTTMDALEKFLLRHKGEHFVLKSNTLAPSRIMIDSSDTDALLSFASKLFERGPVLLEEHIKGVHLTATILVDNNGYFALPITSDYMYSSEEDGVPTGGMGSVCPITMSQDINQLAREMVIEPTIYGMKVEQLSYKGVLTISIIVNSQNIPVVVDYHVRFNDPATQAMVPLIGNDLVQLLTAMEEDRLNQEKLILKSGSTVAVVVASRNYPMNPEINKAVCPISPILLYNTLGSLPYVFTGAVRGSKEDELVTSGGRCFTIVGHGETIRKANEEAYRYVNAFRFDGCWYREDIGNAFMIQNEN